MARAHLSARGGDADPGAVRDPIGPRAGAHGPTGVSLHGRVGGRGYRRGMSTHRTHVCVYFDDGDLELLCVCGSRAVDVEGTVVALEEDLTVTAVLRTPRRHEELAVSA